MSFRYLTREEMVSTSASLVNEDHEDCRAIKDDPMSSVLLELIAGAHTQLIRAQIPLAPGRLDEIRDALAELSQRYNDVVRGLYHGLMAQEYLADRDDDKERARQLRAFLFPDNLKAVSKSYRGKIGQARLLENHLGDDDRAHLGRLSTMDGKNFLALLEEWFAVARAMGELENERATYKSDAPSAADVVAARNHWIRAMRLFIGTLRLRGDVPERVIAIVDRIEAVAAERAARRRKRRRKPARSETQAPATDLAPQPVMEPDRAPVIEPDMEQPEEPGAATGAGHGRKKPPGRAGGPGTASSLVGFEDERDLNIGLGAEGGKIGLGGPGEHDREAA